MNHATLGFFRIPVWLCLPVEIVQVEHAAVPFVCCDIFSLSIFKHLTRFITVWVHSQVSTHSRGFLFIRIFKMSFHLGHLVIVMSRTRCLHWSLVAFSFMMLTHCFSFYRYTSLRFMGCVMETWSVVSPFPLSCFFPSSHHHVPPWQAFGCDWSPLFLNVICKWFVSCYPAFVFFCLTPLSTLTGLDNFGDSNSDGMLLSPVTLIWFSLTIPFIFF